LILSKDILYLLTAERLNNQNARLCGVNFTIIKCFIIILADYPALPGYLFIPIFYQPGKGMNSIYRVKLK
jgi:hypothetical protein